jgi:hypothetical protein
VAGAEQVIEQAKLLFCEPSLCVRGGFGRRKLVLRDFAVNRWLTIRVNPRPRSQVVFHPRRCALTISSISPLSTSAGQPASSQTNFRQTFNQLVSALNFGDLFGAQQAFSALGQLQSSGQGPLANSKTPFAQALGQLGQALQNDDVTAAKQALSTLPPGLARLHGHHGHHGHQGVNDQSTPSGATASSGAPGSSSGTTGSSSPGNSVDLTV